MKHKKVNFVKINIIALMLCGCTTYRTPDNIIPVDYCGIYKPAIYTKAESKKIPINVLTNIVYNNNQYIMFCEEK